MLSAAGPPRLDRRARPRAAAAARRHPAPGRTGRRVDRRHRPRRRALLCRRRPRSSGASRSSRRGRGLTEGQPELAEQIIHKTLERARRGRGPDVRPRPPGARRVRDGLRRPRRPAAGRREPPRGGQRMGGVLGVRPGPGLPDARWPSACSRPLGRFDEALAQTGQLLGAPDLSDAERSYTFVVRGVHPLQRQPPARRPSCASSAPPTSATCTTTRASSRWPRGGWPSSRRGGWTCRRTLRWIHTAEHTALSKADDILGVPFLCDVADMLGALGDLDGAQRYLAQAFERDSHVLGAGPGHEVHPRGPRRGSSATSTTALSKAAPLGWWRIKLVGGLRDGAQAAISRAPPPCATMLERELLSLGFVDFESPRRGADRHRARHAPAARGPRRRRRPPIRRRRWSASQRPDGRRG